MSRLDAVIFGATGFTGKYAVIHMLDLAKRYNVGSWAVAGRSEKKLEDLMAEAAKKTGADVSNVKIIIADVSNEKSLQDMCAQAKVVINCCGPYRLYGEPVVKAAIENKAHYIDVSGEPQFMELMQLRYDDLAREAGVYVISACGWDSIPADMGVVFLDQNFGGTLNSVRSYLTVYPPPSEILAKAERPCLINYGTWESLILGLTHYNELPALRKKLYPDPMPSFKPKLFRETIHRKDGKGKYYLPFLGSDESIIYRTQRYIYNNENKRPVQFKAYVKTGNFYATTLALITAITLFILTKLSFTRNMLLKYPEFFSFGKVSRQGPTDVVLDHSKFTFELVGEGWEQGSDVENTKPNKKVVAKVSGTNAYGVTCTALLFSFVAILHEREKMPGSGGVLTTGAAFRNTSLIKNLSENNLKYEIVESKGI